MKLRERSIRPRLVPVVGAACALVPSLLFYAATWGVLPLAPLALWVALPAVLALAGIVAWDVTRRLENGHRWAAGALAGLLATLVFDAMRLAGIAIGIVPLDFVGAIGELIVGPGAAVAAAFVAYTYDYLFMVLPWGAAYGVWAAGRSPGWGGAFGLVLWMLVMVDPLVVARAGFFGLPDHLLFAGFALVMHVGWGLGLGWLTNRFYRPLMKISWQARVTADEAKVPAPPSGG